MREEELIERAAQLFNQLRPAILPVVLAAAGANVAKKTGQPAQNGAMTGLVLAELLRTDWAQSLAGGAALAAAIGVTGLLNWVQLPSLGVTESVSPEVAPPIWAPYAGATFG